MFIACLLYVHVQWQILRVLADDGLKDESGIKPKTIDWHNYAFLFYLVILKAVKTVCSLFVMDKNLMLQDNKPNLT